MSETPYQELREHLDRNSLGFPETDSGVEIRILEKLFSEDEAEFAMLMTPLLENVDQIAERTGLGKTDLEERLESMSKKGLLFRIRRSGVTTYRLAPFMIGLYEYSVDRIDRELALLFREYYDSAYLGIIGASGVPGFKVIPVSENIDTDQVLLPFHTLEGKIRDARKISVAECVCRKESQLIGDGCDYPIGNCLHFGVAAEYYIENGSGREINAEEAIEILREADRAGLVHAGANSKHLSNICNCCPCCCASMKGITELGHDKHRYLNALYEAIVDREACIECEDCAQNCPVDAMQLEDAIQVDRQRCLGCGICATHCASDAISMHLREDREEPFDSLSEMGRAVYQAMMAKGRST